MSKVLKIDPLKPSLKRIEEVVEVIKRSGVVVYPTETLYGLGINPLCSDAVARLYEMKGRQRHKPIPFLIRNLQMLTALVENVPPIGKTLMQTYWPGPLTLIFWAREELPFPLRGENGKIGVRISAHPIARMILEILDTPLTATSANPAGRGNVTSVRKIHRMFGHHADLIVDGGDVTGMASTIVDVTETPPKIVRQGMIRVPVFQEE